MRWPHRRLWRVFMTLQFFMRHICTRPSPLFAFQTHQRKSESVAQCLTQNCMVYSLNLLTLRCKMKTFCFNAITAKRVSNIHSLRCMQNYIYVRTYSLLNLRTEAVLKPSRLRIIPSTYVKVRSQSLHDRHFSRVSVLFNCKAFQKNLVSEKYARKSLQKFIKWTEFNHVCQSRFVELVACSV